jgi:hypothetical protein
MLNVREEPGRDVPGMSRSPDEADGASALYHVLGLLYQNVS